MGDRVVVAGGYDYEPAWLRGGAGYSGTIVEVDGEIAVVELDEEITLDGSWQDFGDGSAQALRTVSKAQGRWLALLQGCVGGSGPTQLDAFMWACVLNARVQVRFRVAVG